ncbi:16S rRNA (guanine(527)-N(7))-methyltransferase RsmG [Stakelama sediminis]|uniref:Ribosomal RNA small subunit methyltransferase G n=1 Tax=Stakelama sediminis TaxID=463200 RepID=A0A840Z238_9SPHN|nr:16S rRNA (guanine(527)-N(7))-methyltransferase RsmG [Stakelama sediminis]MBB5719827.1 16S rRNA (guanine527-N7)-methyltransferase [Stakelama sediminis]
MTEHEARQWIIDRFGVSRETQIERFCALVLEESNRQNLIAQSTIPEIWARHIVDSAQLIGLAPDSDGEWLDIGSGAGFPGIVVAILRDAPIRMIEPRKRRVDFLASACETLGLRHVSIDPVKVEKVMLQRPAAIISARAVAALPKLFSAGAHLADKNSCWLLPKGQSVHSEVEEARKSWQGVFHVEQSLTNSDSAIVVAREVRSR